VIGFTFGLFLKPVSQEFGWSRGAMSAASGAATLMMAMAVPFTGLLVDRWGVRRVLLPVIVLSAFRCGDFAHLGVAVGIRRALCHRGVGLGG
jgi:MFS family permease